MNIDTENTVYLGLDLQNNEVRVLMPRRRTLQLVELNLSDPTDPTDKATFTIACEEMDEHRFDL